jgi:hypothetical protein
MKKLNLEFSAGQVMKSLWLNLIAQKTDEIVDEVNKLPEMSTAITENANAIQSIKDSEVDISQAEFDALQESGELDPSKTYYIYE